MYVVPAGIKRVKVIIEQSQKVRYNFLVTCGRRRRRHRRSFLLTTWQRVVRLMAVWKHINALNGWRNTKRNVGDSWLLSTVLGTILEVRRSPHSVASLLATRPQRR